MEKMGRKRGKVTASACGKRIREDKAMRSKLIGWIE